MYIYMYVVGSLDLLLKTVPVTFLLGHQAVCDPLSF
jgi:hypothetical protein